MDPHETTRLAKIADVCTIIGFIMAICLGFVQVYLWLKHGEISVNGPGVLFCVFVLLLAVAGILHYKAARLRSIDYVALVEKLQTMQNTEAPKDSTATVPTTNAGMVEHSGSRATVGMTIFREHGATEFSHRTSGAFKSEIDLRCHPTKIHLESPVNRNIEARELPVELTVPGGSIAIVQFTDNGIQLNERGISGIALEGMVVSVDSVNPQSG